jgi:hypothetical protein
MRISEEAKRAPAEFDDRAIAETCSLRPVCPLNRLTYSGGVNQSIELSSDRVIENIKNGAIGVPDLEML